MSEAKTCNTPHQDNLFEVMEDSGENYTLDVVANRRYLSVVMLSTASYIFGCWEKLMRVLMYLKGTPKLGTTVNYCNGLQLHGHCDASFGTHSFTMSNISSTSSTDAEVSL